MEERDVASHREAAVLDLLPRETSDGTEELSTVPDLAGC